MGGTQSLAGAFAALALFGVGGAFAQSPAPSPGLQSPGPQSPGPQPDGERMALAQQIYQMIGGQTLNATSGALKAMLSSMTASSTGDDSGRQQAMRAALGDSLDKMMPKVLQGSTRIMAQDFTVDQLRGMLAFYQSPTGQAVLQKMPEVTTQSIRLSQSLIPQMMIDFEADYCRRIPCSDKEQAAFAQVNARMSQAFAAHPSAH